MQDAGQEIGRQDRYVLDLYGEVVQSHRAGQEMIRPRDTGATVVQQDQMF